MLYLNHQAPQWWQFLTCTFCHASWQHLSSNIFFLYIFGKAVEEEEGAFGVWFSYLVTGCGRPPGSGSARLPRAATICGVGTSRTPPASRQQARGEPSQPSPPPQDHGGDLRRR